MGRQSVREHTSPAWEVGVASTRSRLAGDDGWKQRQAAGQKQGASESHAGFYFPVLQQPQQQVPGGTGAPQQQHSHVAVFFLIRPSTIPFYTFKSTSRSSRAYTVRMRIGEVARRSGVPAHTIRFYETRNIVARAPRSRAGYRVYSDQVIGELGFVRRAQSLGFTLDEIKEILALGRGGKLPCARVAALCDAHLREIDARLAEMRRFQRHLREARRQAKLGCGFTPEGFCRAIMGHPPERDSR